MSAFLYGARLFDNPADPARPIRHTLRGFRGPIGVGEGLIHVPCTSQLTLPAQFYFDNARQMGLHLVMVLDNLKLVNHNFEQNDKGALLQFASPREALIFKLAW